MSLLTPGASNAKTAKHAQDLGIESVILHLAPASLSGKNLCPMASPGCAAACLNTAGRGGFDATQEARIRKSQYFNENRAGFLEDLVSELKALVLKASKNGRKPVARLNGTSDIPWEKFPVIRNGIEYQNVFAAFPDVTFYDYTKVVARLERCQDIPNYRLTFSASECNDCHCLRALELGYNVAVVLRDAAETFAGYPVISGDEHDYRFLDPMGGHIVALTPKGKARHDDSGFVRDGWDCFHPERTPRFATQA